MMWPAPTELHKALKRVREEHPYSSTGKIARSERADSDARTLWRRVLEAPEEQQRALVAGLERLEVGLMAYGASEYITEPIGVRVLRFAAQEHESFSSYKVVVELFVAGDGDPGFAKAAKIHANQRGNAYWQRLVLQARPLLSLCEDYLGSTVDLETFLQNPEVGFAWSVAIQKAARRLLLAPTMVAKTIKREGLRKWERWFTLEYSEEEREQWFIWYLQTDLVHKWAAADGILRVIQRRYGEPDDSTPFWSKAGAELTRKFRRWLLDSQLTDLLGETDRTRFWREFLHSITRCTASKDESAVFIEGGRWYAVQFVEMGRATYLFQGSVSSRLRRLSVNELYSWVLSCLSIDRYEHRGSNWQFSARRVVMRVIRAYSN